MLRCALWLAVALAVLCGTGEALAARTTTLVSGDIRTLAFTGDGLTIAHRPPGQPLIVERFVTGAQPQSLLTTNLATGDVGMTIAGSAQAIAIGVQPQSSEGPSENHTFIGPARGPLREVSTCAAGLLAAPVAVLGPRIAWRDGGCGEPAGEPLRVSPAAIVIGAADPAVAPRRIALEPDALPVSIALVDDGGLVGILRPSFFAVDSEVRTFGPAGIGATLLGEDGQIVTPVGPLPDRATVYSLSKVVLGEDDDQGTCQNSLFTIAAGAAQRRALDAGGCPRGADAPSDASSPRVGAGRVFALVSPSPQPRDDRQPLVSLVSVGGDGSDRRVHAQGSYRAPLGFAVDGDRVAFWHEPCTPGNSEVVTIDSAGQDGGPSAIASCRATILTRSARVRDAKVAVKLRCPAGCTGTAFAQGRELPRRLRAFEYTPGTHTIRLPLSKADRRSGRLRLQLLVENGAARSAVVRLRR